MSLLKSPFELSHIIKLACKCLKDNDIVHLKCPDCELKSSLNITYGNNLSQIVPVPISYLALVSLLFWVDAGTLVGGTAM